MSTENSKSSSPEGVELRRAFQLSNGTVLAVGCAGVAMFTVLLLVIVIGAYLAITRVTPIPTPAPAPDVPAPDVPTPTPSGFAHDLRSALKRDKGTTEDAQILAAMFHQCAISLGYDAKQASPRINNANAMGKALARLQQYKWGADETPMGGKFPSVEREISEEISLRLTGQTFDSNAAQKLYAEAGDAMRSYE